MKRSRLPTRRGGYGFAVSPLPEAFLGYSDKLRRPVASDTVEMEVGCNSYMTFSSAGLAPIFFQRNWTLKPSRHLAAMQISATCVCIESARMDHGVVSKWTKTTHDFNQQPSFRRPV